MAVGRMPPFTNCSGASTRSARFRLCRFHLRALTAACASGLAVVAGFGITPLAGFAQARSAAGIAAAGASFQPDVAMARRLFKGVDGISRIERVEANPPVWRIFGAEEPAGFIASTWEVAGSVGYSGRPIDIVVGVSSDARIAGAELIHHNEPILTLGISSEDIAKYVSAFAGYDLKRRRIEAFENSADLPPIIAGASVSTGVIRDAVLRTARAVALGHGIISTGTEGIDRVGFEEKDWGALIRDGAVAHTRVTFAEAQARFGETVHRLPETSAPFIELWLAVLDPPTIGRNLLGQQAFTRAVGSVGPGDTTLFIASSGLHSHRGSGYRQSGIFERLEVIQGERTIKLAKEDYLRVDKLALASAPELKEISIFRLSAQSGFEPARPFRIEVSAQRERADGSKASLVIPLRYELPSRFVRPDTSAASVEPETPLWVSAWERKPVAIGFTVFMITCVAASFFIQEFFVRRPMLWLYGRLAFLSVTLVGLGWIAKGQLSVVQVVAFIHSLFHGFRWETFLLEPVIFLLWGFVALGLLFWGRGVYCGWLCPFGALQELLNEAAKKLGVRQIEIPFAIQERAWAIKYTLFVVILGLSFYSMERALVLAEAEPFKTAISMHFMREWPFVVFVAVLLAAGLFIERFYCRYLCPLGAALAIPAKLKLFDWLHRRPQCGRECRFCETQCTVGAIDTLGRINPNECILCLRCQVIMNDDAQCVVLKRRAGRGTSRGGGLVHGKSSDEKEDG